MTSRAPQGSAGRLLLLAMLVFVAGCEKERPGGKCVGINGPEKPGVTYEYSETNIVVGAVFIETVVVPVVVVLNELKCPVQSNVTR